MPEIIEFTQPEKLLEKYEELREADSMFILYFTGSIGENGKSWCPDCDTHRAIIEENVINLTPCIILKGLVEDRNEWVGVSTHPFKIHPIIKAKGVPTVLLC